MGADFLTAAVFSVVVISAPLQRPAHGSTKNWNAVNYGRFDMGAFWNPHGGVVLNNKKLSKNEVSHLKREWLAQHHNSVGPVGKWWKKVKMVINLFSPLK